MDEREFLNSFFDWIEEEDVHLDDRLDVQEAIRMFLEHHLVDYKPTTFELRKTMTD